MEFSADKPNPSWLLKTLEVVVVPIASTMFELLLLGFAAFFPAYLFKIKEQSLIIYLQIIIVSITVAFFQGCRSLGRLSYIKKFSHNFQRYYWISGLISAIPINLIVFVFFSLYSQNPLIDPAKVKYAQLFATLVILLNFTVGVRGSLKQYKAIEQNRPKEAMRLFYPSVAFMLLGWMIIFLLLIFIFRLDISSRFPG